MKRTIFLVLIGFLWGVALQGQVFPFDVTAGPGLGLAIPDDAYDGSLGSMACSSVIVPGNVNGDILIASVETRINHTWVGDLVMKLYPPTGGVVTVFSRPGFSEAADDGTGGFGDSSNLDAGSPITFRDGLLNPSAEDMGSNISGGEVIGHPGNVSSADYESNQGATSGGSLDSVVGFDAPGTWTLCVGDAASGDTGTLDSWTLHLTLTPCAAGDFNLCLLTNNLGTPHFDVRMEYQASSGGPFADGHSTSISDQAGFFYFTNPANMEILVKMIDACTVTNSYWLFISGLTDRGIKVTVEDIGTGADKTFESSLGSNFLLVKDFNTFTCQ